MRPNTSLNVKGNIAVIIPVFNHAGKVARVVRSAQELDLPVFVIDDGSTDATYDQIRDIKGIHLFRHNTNKGKGAAILTGFEAATGSFDWAITMDADGQHHPEDAVKMISALPNRERPILVGLRKDMTVPGVHWTSRFGRKFSNFWVRAAGGPPIGDTQSGFRVYPLPESMALNVRARRFQFEVEILVKAAWHGIPVMEVPIEVSYQPEGGRISHFKPFIDFVRNTRTFSRLITQRILLPSSVRKRL
jgi:glycosyltransferase involved in cell wall biosynthesis